MNRSEAISPTAHYTGYVWARNGLSHPELATLQGHVMFESLRPTMAVGRALGGATLEGYLLARHRGIDVLLARAIERHGVAQVIEVAAGLSPRGWRFTERYGERLTYVEADLPGMASRKRQALKRMGSLTDRHRVAEVDALADDGPDSITALTAQLDPTQGLAIITEGLLGYLPRRAVDGIWRRFARALREFATGRYISDLHLAAVQNVQVRAFRKLLSAFVRGRVYLHFDTAEQAVAAVRAAGFAEAELHRAADLAGAARDLGAETARDLGAETARDTGAETARDPGAETARDPGAETGRDPGAWRSRDPGARLAHILEASTR
jgi:O-methyltransferase involved in polyketide biosynthesis